MSVSHVAAGDPALASDYNELVDMINQVGVREDNVFLDDDFFYGLGAFGTTSTHYGRWWYIVQGSGVAALAGSGEGAVSLTTTTGTADSVVILNRIYRTGINFTIEFRASCPTPNANSRWRFGLADITTFLWYGTADTQNGANSLLFKADGVGNIFATSRASSTETSTATDTSVAQSSNYKIFQIVISGGGTTVTYKIDGVTVATHSSNIPATSADLSLVIGAFNNNASAGGTAVRLKLDYVRVYANVTRPTS